MRQRTLRHAAPAALALLLLAGCASPEGRPSEDAALNHPIAVGTRLFELASPGPSAGHGELDRLRAFAAGFLETGVGPLRVSAATRPALGEAVRALAAVHVPPERMRADVDPAVGRGVLLSFEGRVARLPACGEFRSDARALRGWDNAPASEWGCATRRNLGAMLANPGDLNGMRPPPPLHPAARPAGAAAAGGGGAPGGAAAPAAGAR